jgi:hypothetical protein
VKAPKARYAIAICARRIADKRASADNETFTIGAAISRMIYDAFSAKAPAFSSKPSN